MRSQHVSKGQAGGGVEVRFAGVGFDVADPLRGDETLAGFRLPAGVEDGGVHGYVGRSGDVDKGDEGGGPCAGEDGKDGGSCIVSHED